ncbi:copper radical oxidase [Bipolaris oryzae ATCC 44560]|uniref:Copper radical oxidase n=1 Tax=Bipolaris oryzae ATCC 44560 TaxID=930090 RepID=W6Z007_COCMI|nr:copper radical oxidase [Bipolaris oryzae ATCC 44560]EUC43170.1 copper radical oxidase [Bipolaris oryzae ATCC 44560]
MKLASATQVIFPGVLFAFVSDATHLPRAVIGKCPSGERSTFLINNRIYNICPGTDYWSPNVKIVPDTANVDACVIRCSETEGCAKASYNSKLKTCYLKGDPEAPIWFETPDLDTIRVGNVPQCPTDERFINVNDGKFTICPGTDYWSPNVQIIPDIVNVDACVTQCAQDTSTCEKASYNSKLRTCYLKGKPASPVCNHPGQWGKVFPLPVIPVAGYVVPEWPESNRLLFWSAWATNKFSLWSPPNGYTQFADYNYKTGALSQRTVSNTRHDMFCPSISALADGRIVITGGTNAEVTSIYEPSTNQFVRGPDMKIPRGYQTSATLSDGRVFTIGGSFSGARGGKNGEVYDPRTNTWTVLPNARVEPLLTSYDWEGDWRTDNHAWLFSWSNGSVFHAGPSKGMHWYGTTGSGSVQDAGIRDPEADAMCGVHVMFDIGRIFSAGGSQSYTASPATSRAHLITITEAFKAATVERLPRMNDPRGFANVVVLPNGQVLVLGGQRVSRVFQDDESVLTPELFDPATKTFRRLAPAAEPRNYHSIAILLSDGRVFTGGGGMCGNLAPGQSEQYCNRAIDHQNGQIFTPPYLLNQDGSLATRPIIFAVESKGYADGRIVKVGGTIIVYMNYPNDHTFSLVRMGSVTHSVNSDQRRVPMNNVQRNAATFTMKLPNDSGVLIPGFYYLFAMDARGVPSIAKTLQVVL